MAILLADVYKSHCAINCCFTAQVSLSRAKEQLKSAMMMNLESKMVVFEDIGRQLLGQGFKMTPEELTHKIGKN